MPGIHVRSLGKLDWIERANEPTLTIPGAYWLCHKKRIYKFTFKWHKTLRNTEGFAYPKELTKVIRRIIKSQPRQGQQFGTRHLLVTYNHSAWLRQDKMFAMLKFRDRTDATAFSHAFVLTVKTLNVASAEESCPVDKAIDCVNTGVGTQRHDIELKTDETNHDNSEDYSSREERTKNVSDAIASFIKPENKREEDSPNKTASRPKSHDEVEPMLSAKRLNRQGRPTSEKIQHNELPDFPATKVPAVDLVDLPYQYIIEKEIENSKSIPEDCCLAATEAESGSGHRQSHGQSSPTKLQPRSPRAAQTDSARSADITDLVMEGLMFTIRQDKDSVTVVEQKTKLEMDEVLENSVKAETKAGEKCLLNSSLLRLENLITKIEMPEAKQKTNEDVSKSPAAFGSDKNADQLPFHPSSSGSATNSSSSRKYTMSSPRTHGQSHDSAMPMFPFVKINLNNIRDVLNHNLELDTMGNGQVIQECHRQDQAMEEEEEDEVGLELKYEEKDDTEIGTAEANEDNQEAEVEAEAEAEEKEEDIAPRERQQKSCEDLTVDKTTPRDRSISDLATTPIKECLKMIKSNTPRIISNEIVTDEQIPPELRQALRHKRTRRLSFDPEIEAATAESTATITTDEDSKVDTLPDRTMDREPPIDTIDITDQFERRLLTAKRRIQPPRRKRPRHGEGTSSNTDESPKEPEIRIEMWKFMQDIMHGAKVVVRRLDLTNIRNSGATEASLSKYNVHQRYVTKS